MSGSLGGWLGGRLLRTSIPSGSFSLRRTPLPILGVAQSDEPSALVFQYNGRTPNVATPVTPPHCLLARAPHAKLSAQPMTSTTSTTSQRRLREHALWPLSGPNRHTFPWPELISYCTFLSP